MRKPKAQNIIEYSIILGIVTSIFVAMQVYLKRGIQQAVRISADQLGSQEKGLAETNPRKDTVTKSLAATKKLAAEEKSEFFTIDGKGGGRGNFFSENSTSISNTISERKDDGIYYVDGKFYQYVDPEFTGTTNNTTENITNNEEWNVPNIIINAP